MTRLNASNFSGSLQFTYGTVAGDAFKKEDVQILAQAVDQHDHSSGKGLAVVALGAGVAASNIGALGGALSGTLPNPSIATLAQNLLFVDNTYDIGASGATRPRNLYLAGSALAPTYYVGSTNERIRTPATAANSLSLESADGSVLASGLTAYLTGNIYFDGTNWQRFNVANSGTIWAASSTGLFMYSAPAGSNPATVTQKASIDTSGSLTVSGNVISPAFTFPGVATSWINADASAMYLVHGTSIHLGANVVISAGANDLNCQSISLLQGSNRVIYWGDGSHYLQYDNASRLYWTHNFQAGGTITGNGAYINSASSRGIKDQIVALDSEACLAQVCALESVSFRYVKPSLDGQRLGFIIEDVAEVVPQATVDDGLSSEALLSVLWGAVRELSAQLRVLQGASA